jgi:YVTN family beta-propeller protein
MKTISGALDRADKASLGSHGKQQSLNHQGSEMRFQFCSSLGTGIWQGLKLHVVRRYALVSIGIAAVIVAGSAHAATAGEFVYIPLGSAGEVAIVDVEQGKVVGKIQDLPAVHGLAGTPDGRFLVAGSYDERVPGGEVPAKPSTVSEDEHAAHHGGSNTSVERTGSVISTLSIVDTASQSVIRRIDVPGAVHHVAISPDSRLAVVTHPNEGTISAVDLQTYDVMASVATGPLPNYAAFSPDGGQIYVSNAGNNTVSAIDSKRWFVLWNTVVGGSPEHVVLSEDGSTLYINNVDDGTVSIITPADRKVERTIQIGTVLHGIDLSDDGRTLFVGALGDDKVVAYDLATGTYRSVRLAPAPYHLATVRSANKIYVSSADEPKVWVLDPETLAVLGEIPIGGKGHQMVQGPGA